MKKIFKIILYAVVVFSCIHITSCNKLSSYDFPASSASAYEVIKADINFSIFRYMIDKANLQELLNGQNAYTVFTPTNSAFTASGYPLSILQSMPADSVGMLVKNHIIAGKVDVTTFSGSQKSLSNTEINLQTIAKSYYADGADITNTNLTTINGYVNVINKVLVTRTTLLEVISKYTNATANLQLTFLAAAIARASTGSTDFTNILSGTDAYTFFAPNNGAFIDAGYATIAAVQAASPDVLGNILKYHLIVGAKVTTAFDSVPVAAFNGINIYFDKLKPSITTQWYANGIIFGNSGSPNIVAKNGVMHTISRFLPTPVTNNTLDRIESDATLSMFYELILRASTVDPKFNFQKFLSEALSSYTVFAVNNSGLQAAGYANIAAINAEKPVVLADILKLHLIPKRINNISIAENGAVNSLHQVTNSAGTISTNALTFTMTGGFKIKGPSNQNSIPVITGNVVTTNGLLNIIGSMLQP